MNLTDFDELAEFVVHRLLNCRFFIFGAGQTGAQLKRTLDFLNLDNFEGFVDNSADKQKAGWEDREVISLEEYLQKDFLKIIIICCSQKNRPVIEEQLAARGLKKNIDFYADAFFRTNILPAIVLYKQEKVYMSLAQICVTERCTLRCRKCAHGCAYVPADSRDTSLADVKASADEFFRHIDYVEYFHLIGGEPLLYRDLADALDYIGDRYGHQIYRLCVTTNGTMLPKENLLNSLKRQNVLFYISNYKKTIPDLSDRYDALERILKEYRIEYIIDNYEQEWTDYGFDSLDRGFFKDGKLINDAGPKELIRVFQQCKTPCREVRKDRLYYCVAARACAENMGFKVGEHDFLDISTLDDSFDSKRKLAMFEMGYIEKGYLDMCNYCYGAEREQHPVRVAEQLSTKRK